jgi:hypothetical protein
MKNVLSIFSFILFSISISFGQMVVGTDTLYGNEWINANQSYYKIEVGEDGIYHITGQTLTNAGVPTASIAGNEWQIFHLGEEIPIFTSTSGVFGSNDYIAFFGEKNRATLDSFLFQNPSTDLLNPYYSLFTDTAAYYLTWISAATGLRYQDIPNNLANPPTKEDYFMYDDVNEFHEVFTKKRANGYIYDSAFEVEGFSHGFSNNTTFNISPKSVYSSGVPSTLSIRLAQGEDGTHRQKISVNGTEVLDETSYGYMLKNYTLPVNTASIGSTMQINTTNTYDNKDKSSVAYIKLHYPRVFNFDNANYFEFYIDASSSDKYLEIENFNANNTNPVLLDLTNRISITTTYDATVGKVKVVLPPSSEKRRLVLYTPTSAAKTVNSVKNIHFTDYSQLDADYVILTTEMFNKTINGKNWVQEYADYRKSNAGGSYNVQVVNVEDLYEHFGYGVERNTLAVKNFSSYIVKNWQSAKYVFMIGKAVEYPFLRTQTNLAAHAGLNYFVPTFGYIGSDIKMFGTFDKDYPEIAVGRLAARSADQIRIYLEKITGFERNQTLPQTLEDKAWMKRMIHLGGGDPSIQGEIKTHLNSFKDVIENNQYGGSVHSFFKTSSDPIQISQSDKIAELINTGVSILTFFGHSYAGGFDISLDNPSSYENEGKYPLIISYGCYSGRIHSTSVGISEDFVLTEDRGAIAFMSTNSIASIGPLKNYGISFYDELGGNSYGLGLGEVIKNAIKNANGSIGSIARLMTLHGDPALRLNFHPGPDYLVDESSIAFTPSTVDIQEDSFRVKLDIVNIGQHIEDTSFIVRIIQELPSGDLVDLLNDTIATPSFRSTLEYDLPTLGEASVGLNKIYVTVDATNRVSELPVPDAELNNDLVNNLGNKGVELYFSSNNIRGVYPFDKSILGNTNIILKATSSNPFASPQNYVFQIDTTEEFNSPLKQSQAASASGGVVTWQPNVNYQDSTVYYWRVSADSVASIGYNWDKNSFQYISGLVGTGWGQSHYHQFKDSRYSNMRLNDNRRIDFIDDFKDLIYTNIVNVNNLNRARFTINNGEYEEIDRTGFNKNGDLMIAVLDSITLIPWINPPGGRYGGFNEHSTLSLNAFWFYTDNETERQKVINFLRDTVPAGNYVLFMTLQRNYASSYQPELWAADSTNLGTNIFQVLETQGATSVREMLTKGAVPYVFLYQKDKALLVEEIADTITGIVAGSYALPGSWDNGYVESPKIGPAKDWNSLHWRASSQSNSSTDHYSMDIIGVDKHDAETVLYEGLTAWDTTINYIDANVYPFLKLRFNSLDTAFKTSANLDTWRIMYQGVPEFVIAPNQHYEFYGDTLEQGEILNFEIGLENISQENGDSLLVKYVIKDAKNTNIEKYQRVKPLIVGDTAITFISVDTRNMQAKSSLTLQINPNEDQLEQFLFNNTAIKNFYVKADERHPLLDVTFDGVHILDGDIVSTKPQILMQLKDENQYLALSDTNAFKIWLVNKDGNQIRQFIDGQKMLFYPADENNVGEINMAKIEFNPTFEEDGIYQLIVQAQDRAGNASGTIDYKTSFEVITASAISYVLNYPNPFTTSTQFVFTLTGAQVPDDLRISIYTVSGRLIREIRKEELGPLRIGQNRTEYRWDGTDEFGDKLANGVYLYRVSATINGEQLENHYTKASPYFHNGFGKMVIIR